MVVTSLGINMASNAVAKSDSTKTRSVNENCSVAQKTMKEGFGMGLKVGGLDHLDLLRLSVHEQTSRRNNPRDIGIATEVLKSANTSGRSWFNSVAMTKIDGPAVNAETSAKYSLMLTTGNS